MEAARWSFVLSASVSVSTLGCHSSNGGTTGSATTSPSVLASTARSTPKDGCPTGLIRVDSASFETLRAGRVKVEAFCLAREEVRASSYAACVTDGACTEPDRGGDCNAGMPGREDHPANCIDHEQATRYCTWAGGRLPSVVEWQWVAQGELASTLYPWGNEPPSDNLCWSGKTRRHETCAIGAFAHADDLRAFVDLNGNVRQWSQSEADGGSGFFATGGSFEENVASYFEARSPRALPSTNRSGEVGARCAASLGSPPLRGREASAPEASARAAAPVPSSSSLVAATSASPAAPAPIAPSAPSSECAQDAALVRGGSFVPAGERTSTRVDALCVDIDEVTVARFTACVAKGACAEPDHGGACNWPIAARSDDPINCVSQSESAAYCSWAGGRLPTIVEAEWVARNGAAATDYPWGNVAPTEQKACWSGKSMRRNTCPVGTFPDGRSKDGINDLIGNVLEWTTTPSQKGVHRFRLGGGDFTDTDPTSMRWTSYWDEVDDTHLPELGFRCVAKVKH